MIISCILQKVNHAVYLMENNSKPKLLRTEIKHAAIMNAAKELFLNLGYLATSTNAIADKACVSKRTIYEHFGNKNQLFANVLQEHWNLLLNSNHNIFNENQTITDNLKNFANIFLKFLYQQDTIDLFRLLISESNKFPDLIEHILVDDKAPFTRKLTEFLTQNKDNGKLIIDDVDRAGSYFIGLLKEYHFWPMMLGFTKQKKLVDQQKLIDDAVWIFLEAYKNKLT